MKKNKTIIINDDNYKNFKVSVQVNKILDNTLKGLTVVKKNSLFHRIFGFKRLKLIDTDTFYYEINICIEGKGYETTIIEIRDLDKSKYLQPFISYYEINGLSFLNVEYLANLNVEHVIKACKKGIVNLNITESEEVIKDIVTIIRKSIKEGNYDLKKKDIKNIDKLHGSVDDFKIKIKDDINNNNLPKNLYEYVDVYGSNSLFNK